MDTPPFIISISALFLVLLSLLFPHIRRLAIVSVCYWLFLICILLSGVAGYEGGVRVVELLRPVTGRLVALLLSLSSVGMLSFLALYRVVVLSIVSVIEKKRQTEFSKPDIKWGITCSAILPFVIMSGDIVVALRHISTGQMHDSL
jgi:hypothetical protein